MKTPTNRGQLAPLRILKALIVSISVGISSLGLWLLALLTAYDFDRALHLVLQQAIWVVPASIIFGIPVLINLPTGIKAAGKSLSTDLEK